MMLHEAMRLGALLQPQIKGAFMTRNGTCAWGATFQAVGYTADSLRAESDVLPEWEKLTLHASASIPHILKLSKKIENYPDVGIHEDGFISEIIVDLNDTCGWTREQIADWLQPIEEAFLHDAHVEAVRTRLLEAEAPVEVSR